MKQHVTEPAHVLGHTLDVVITRESANTISNIEITDPGFSDNTGKASRDHFAVLFQAVSAKSPPIKKTVTFRKLCSFDVESV
ncbi:hypothetical protein DPMN_160387 [Dreissena polymorpha]|uniref:Uncharacterized protein n=1 Tax=Dreissena polymorpha TaxID=45954 RepID=A0A9D4END6_DREPO|nr:hypothetical protein DPMN_160387 [Dreissena polymorpha]